MQNDECKSYMYEVISKTYVYEVICMNAKVLFVPNIRY